ncbi:cysteine dioxygenase family protein [Rossellomorea sp. YZS02]|uniref:cysteine dioxygenase n=1 Tax=Rossellomorea sp. YZS02 TaxID=3097358 RepID=UPI002A0AEC9F|nr:cysteine dioxygenase family protein [Rossellomorea sp. YZS02]MDX8344770.1 cysteine dioxygenase family protein [Rossellomorea sp. YZS02]
MTLKERIKNTLDELTNPSTNEMKEVLQSLHLTLEELQPYLQSPEGKPYYRKLLYQNEAVELLVMNWSNRECAPHDHGNSKGWIQVMTGTSVNTIFEVKDNQLPQEIFDREYSKGSFFYAPKKGVHKMKKGSGEDLVTVHLYSPPIQGMMVYDLDKCAACVVSDECGAWWPDHLRQKIKEMQLK